MCFKFKKAVRAILFLCVWNIGKKLNFQCTKVSSFIFMNVQWKWSMLLVNIFLLYLACLYRYVASLIEFCCLLFFLVIYMAVSTIKFLHSFYIKQFLPSKSVVQWNIFYLILYAMECYVTVFLILDRIKLYSCLVFLNLKLRYILQVSEKRKFSKG